MISRNAPNLNVPLEPDARSIKLIYIYLFTSFKQKQQWDVEKSSHHLRRLKYEVEAVPLWSLELLQTSMCH